MRNIEVCGIDTDIYDIYDFPYDKFRNCSTVKQGKREYVDIVCAFDIETTSIINVERPFGFMYIWQFCVEDCCCTGRTWSEYVKFLQKLKNEITLDVPIVVWVHNLSFEFQFMRNFFQKPKYMFARDKREVIRTIIEGVEYRCSYALTNMGLDMFLKNTSGVTMKKLSGDDFNYRKLRYPDTELSDKELEYCVVDVMGLCQAIHSKLKEDTLCSIPMTSTGYVRRDYQEACLKDKKVHNHVQEIGLNQFTYRLCQEASRGAIAGSNAIWTNTTIEDVDSFDIKSSYPYQMLTNYYPDSKFMFVNCEYGDKKFEKFLENKCMIFTFTCENLRLKRWECIPYLSKSKCKAIEGGKFGNGKVYSADRIGITCTEVDLKLIRQYYDFDNPVLYKDRVCCAQRGLLPKPFRMHLANMFQTKTDMEDGDPELYMKFKNKINASFGMMLTDILHSEIIYELSDEPWQEKEIVDIDGALNRYYHAPTTFLSYQHGIWVLAHARAALCEGMKIMGRDIVQVDTDSVKGVGTYRKDFEEINERIMKEAEGYDIKPYAFKNGKKVYVGIWEHEHGKDVDDSLPTYSKFRTLGAKKYAYMYPGSDELHITVAGMNKKCGAEYLQWRGGIDMFKSGTKIPPLYRKEKGGEKFKGSGRTASVYNDLIEPETIVVNGHEVTLGSNIAVYDVDYTLGVTNEWLEMICDDEEDEWYDDRG